MGRIALATDLRSRDGTLAKDARIVNGYVERDGDKLYVFKRDAIELADATFSGLGTGLFEADGVLYGSISNRVIKYQNFATPTTATQNTDAPTTFKTVVAHAGAVYGITSDGESVYRKSSLTGSWTLLTSSAGMDNLIGYGAHAAVSYQGYIIVAVNVNDKYWYSADGVTWTAVTRTANTTGSIIQAFVVKGSTLYAFSVSAVRTTTTPTSASGWANPGATDAGVVTSGYGVTVMNDTFYLAAGVSGVARDDVFSSSDALTWATVAATPGFAARENLLLLNKDNTLVVIGGVGAGTGDVWYSTDSGATWTQGISNAPDANTAAWGALLSDTFFFGSGTNEWYSTNSVSYSGSAIGSLVGGNVLASFAKNESGTVFIKTDTAAYTWNGSSLTKVTDAQYPAETVRGAPYLNGIFYVMDTDGTIWGSAEDDPTSWAADNFVTAEFEPDGGVCLAKLVSNIVALGTYTTEMFFDAGNTTGSALSPVQSDPLLIGCAHANTVAQTESFLTWVAQQKAQGTTSHRGRFVVVMSGPSYKRISTPDVERILDTDAFDDVYGEIITASGHMFYVLTLVASAITVVYDFKEGLWYEWKKGTAATSITITTLTQTSGTATATATSHGLSDGDQVTVSGATQAGYNLTVNVTRTGANTFTYPVDSATVTPATGSPVAANWSQSVFDVSGSCNFAGNQAIQLRSTGAVYVFNPSDTDDGGVPIDFQCITEKQDGGNNLQKFMSRLELIGDKVSSTALVRYSDDDYASWSTYRRMDMSLPRVGVNRLGDFHRRAIQIRHTLSAKVRVEALETDVEQGG